MPVLHKFSRHGRHPAIRRSSSGMTILIPMSPDQLRTCLEMGETDENAMELAGAKKLLLLDCRSFVAYNEGHIVGALNVHCPAILRRRSRGTTLPLRTLLRTGHFCSMLANNLCYPVVLYDELGSSSNISKQTTTSVNQITACGDEQQLSTIEFVAKCLQVEAGLKNIFYLERGYQNFSECFPHFSTPACSVPSGGSPPSASPRSVLSCPPALMMTNGRASSQNGGQRSSAALPLSSKTVWDQRSQYDGPVEILPHLWLGSAGDASRPYLLKQLGITALLNVSRSESSCPPELLRSIRYKNIPLRDSPCQVIDCFFQEAFDFIDEAKHSMGKVLVHCRAGISRSATICIAYLMAEKGLRMDEAFEVVRSRRRIVSPNFNFMGQLMEFEKQLFSSTAVGRQKNDDGDQVVPTSRNEQQQQRDSYGSSCSCSSSSTATLSNQIPDEADSD